MEIKFSLAAGPSLSPLLRIAEIYQSLQGEGLLTGTPSVFVRTSGCNLRCWFCDTPYTSWEPEGEDWSIDQIMAEVEGMKKTHRHTVITGGEPMLFAELITLSERLHSAGWHVTIETAGTLFLPLACDLMSISPKLASSAPSAERAGPWQSRHERTRHQPEIVRQLMNRHNYQLKFVINTPADCDLVQVWLAEFPEARRDRVLLMPQGTDAAALSAIGGWLEPYCQEHGLLFCPRKHIEWYGAVRGT